MNLEKNEEFGINNNKCKLIIEGYRKGYFGIFYNILSFKMSQPYFNTGLKSICTSSSCLPQKNTSSGFS